jgi:hypothetical protein
LRVPFVHKDVWRASPTLDELHIPPAHSRFLSKTKCRAQSSPEKNPHRPITPTAPLTRNNESGARYNSGVESQSAQRILLLEGVSPRRHAAPVPEPAVSVPAALPCARTEPFGRLHQVENFGPRTSRTSRTIVRRACTCSLKPVLPHSAQ